jgi:hypothetical protein
MNEIKEISEKQTNLFEKARNIGILVDMHGNFENEAHQKAFIAFKRHGSLSNIQRVNTGILADPKDESSLIDDLAFAKKVLKLNNVEFDIKDDIVTNRKELRTTPFHFRKESACNKAYDLFHNAGLSPMRQKGDTCSVWLMRRPAIITKNKKCNELSEFIIKEGFGSNRYSSEVYFLNTKDKTEIRFLKSSENVSDVKRREVRDSILEKLKERFTDYEFLSKKDFVIKYTKHTGPEINAEPVVNSTPERAQKTNGENGLAGDSFFGSLSKDQWKKIISLIPKDLLVDSGKLEKLRANFLLIPKDSPLVSHIRGLQTVDEVLS